MAKGSRRRGGGRCLIRIGDLRDEGVAGVGTACECGLKGARRCREVIAGCAAGVGVAGHVGIAISGDGDPVDRSPALTAEVGRVGEGGAA